MDRDFLADLFSEFGPVNLRRMFSGYGISVDGTNFALVLRGAIYFRADEQTVQRFEDEGSKPFQYDARGKVVTIGSYWRLPDRLYDDTEELAQWARAALAAAERAAIKKRSKATRSKSKKADKKSSDSEGAKRQISGRQVSKRQASKRQVSKRQVSKLRKKN